MYFLKYRPQTIAELDHEAARVQLIKILAGDKIPHALLFAGPKGIGKTSAARILAKAINCESSKSKDKEPCNRCHVCQEITNGSFLDVIEIDAASNRGIDDIRQLKEKVNLAPIQGKYKVYIIDEAHMLTKEAFNALLKTLEEPPKHVVFILCTTDPEKIIPTVISRLVRIDFAKGSPKEVKESLAKIVEGEKLTVDDKVLDTLVYLSGGSFRDAHKILESLTLNIGKNISWKEAENSLGRWRSRKPYALLQLIGMAKIKDALLLTETLAAEGVDFVEYTQQLTESVHRLILVKTEATSGDEEINACLPLFKLEDLVFLSKLLAQAIIEEKSTLIPQLPLQLALIDFLKEGAGDGGKPKEEDEEDLKDKTDEKSAVEEKVEVKPQKGKIKLSYLEEKWGSLLSLLKPKNHSVSAFLRAARPKNVAGNTVLLEVFYQFHRDRLEEERNKKIVEEGLAQVCNCPMRVKYILGEKKNLAVVKDKAEKKDGEKTREEPVDDMYEVAKEIFGQ